MERLVLLVVIGELVELTIDVKCREAPGQVCTINVKTKAECLRFYGIDQNGLENQITWPWRQRLRVAVKVIKTSFELFPYRIRRFGYPTHNLLLVLGWCVAFVARYREV